MSETRIDELKMACELENKPWTFILESSLTCKIDTDMLFIDTDHTYNQLIQELELHCNNVRKYIGMHDTTSYAHSDNNRSNRGLMDAVNDFLSKHSEWHICYKVDYNNGLTILERI